MIPILNSLRLDAMTANREFAYVPIVFNQRVTELNYPMLAINIFDIVTKKPVFQSYTIK
jgi:2',3'-cyclic-nucleotide 2'-phosphodiesterase (5'-nucleotidase family)